MEIMKVASDHDHGRLLSGLRNPARAGQREAREIGEDLTRPGRLRMDALQTERRLKNAYAALGEIVYEDLSMLRKVDQNDARVIEQLAHIRYYEDELSRLRAEINAMSETS
jgi:hypothetical protein